jgi:methionyl-tRNA formyltransferase
MSIVIVTQEEPFYIPILMNRITNALPDIIAIIILPGLPHGFTTFSYYKRLYDVFGPIDFFKYGILFAHHTAVDFFSRVFQLNFFYSVKSIAKGRNISLFSVKNINSTETLSILQRLSPEIIISIASPQIFKRDVIHSAKHTLNIHAALLPNNRGMMPSFWAMVKGETETGITVHKVDENIDTGDIILQKRIEIKPSDTLHTLQTKVANYGADALIDSVRIIQEGNIVTSSPCGEGSYYSFPTKEAAREFRKHGKRFI